MRTKAKPTSSLVSSTEEDMQIDEKKANLLESQLPNHLFNVSSAFLKESLVSRTVNKRSPVLDFCSSVVLPSAEDDSSDSPGMVSTGGSIDSEEMEEDEDEEEEEEEEEYEDEAELMRLAFAAAAAAASANRMTVTGLPSAAAQPLATPNKSNSDHSTTFMPYGLSTCLTSESQNTLPVLASSESSSSDNVFSTLQGKAVLKDGKHNDIQSKFYDDLGLLGSVTVSKSADVSHVLTTPNLQVPLSNTIFNTLSYMNSGFGNQLTKNPFNTLPASLSSTLSNAAALPRSLTSDFSSAFLNGLPESLLNRNLSNSLNNLSATLPGHLSSCVVNNGGSNGLSNALYNGFTNTPLLSTFAHTAFSNGAISLAPSGLTNTLSNNASSSRSPLSTNFSNSTALSNAIPSHLSMPITSFQPASIAPSVGGNIFYPGPFGPPTPHGGDTCPEALADAAEPNQYLCAICGREFRFEKNMLRHMQKAHAVGDDESVLKCKLCNYTTKHYSNMYVHIRTHTGDKPYWCSACGASFTQGSSLKLHIKSRHEDDMSYFSLNKKLGKNNLTKLWQRVLKKDLKKFCMMESLDVKPHMMSSSSINSLLGSYSAAAASFGHAHPLFALLGHHSPFTFGASNLQTFPSSSANSNSSSSPLLSVSSASSLPLSTIDVKPLCTAATAMAPLNLKLKSEPDLPDPQVASVASWPSLGAAPPQPMSSCSSSISYAQHEAFVGLACADDRRDYLAAQKVFPLNLSAEAWSHSTAQMNLNRLYPNSSSNGANCSHFHSYLMQSPNAPKTTSSTSMPVTANVSLDQLQAKANDLHNFMKFNITSSQFAGYDSKSISPIRAHNTLLLRVDKCFQTDTPPMPELAAGHQLSYENAVLREQLKRLRRNAKSLLSRIFPMELNMKDEMEVDECLEKAMRLTHRDS